MTIDYCIDTVDKLIPNEYDREDKIRWLNSIDSELYETLVRHYEGAPDKFDGYSSATPGRTPLIAPEQFNDMYIQFIIAHIYLEREETIKYNNAMNIYNQMMYELRNWYNRSHTRKSDGKIKNYFAWGDA